MSEVRRPAAGGPWGSGLVPLIQDRQVVWMPVCRGCRSGSLSRPDPLAYSSSGPRCIRGELVGFGAVTQAEQRLATSMTSSGHGRLAPSVALVLDSKEAFCGTR